MTLKQKMKILLEASIVLRGYALGDTTDKVIAYRCHCAGLELNALRNKLERQKERSEP